MKISQIKKTVAAVVATVMLFVSVPSPSLASASFSGASQLEPPALTEPSKEHIHTFSSWKTTKKATAKKNGLKERACTNCGQTQKAVIPYAKSVKLSASAFSYTGKAISAKVTVKDGKGAVLKNKRDYTLTYKNNKKVGTATVTVKLMGNYSGTISKTYRIVPAKREIKALVAESNRITAKWNAKSAQISGYYVQAATDKEFKNIAKTIKINSPSASSGVVSGLKAKTVYFVRLRAFKLVGENKYLSPWSAVKSVKTKANIVEKGPHEIAGSVPKSARVSSKYFDDVVFIGDSISLGLTYYEAANDVLGKAQFLTAGSLSATNALWPVSDRSVHPRYKGTKMKLEKAVPLTGAKKVYIMLGMNDINNVGVQKAFENFKTLCANIKKAAPDTVFYIQSVTPRVNLGSRNPRSGLTNANITAYNKMLCKYANEKGWYFVNLASVMFDGNGYLKREYCSDPSSMGMHFTTKGYAAWVDYIYTHTA